MRRLDLILSIGLVMVMVLAVSCGGAGPAPASTVTVTKTLPPATVTISPTPVPPVTVTAPAVTVTVTPTPTPRKLVKVKYAVVAAGTSIVFASLGKQLGFYEKRGIDLELVELSTALSRVAPFTGQADIADGDVIQFYPERKDVRVIGPAFSGHSGLLVRKDSPYRSYKDLVGKKIATPGKTTISHWAGVVIAKMEGVDFEKDLTVLTGESAVIIGWLLKGEVDAIQVYEPGVSKLLVSDGDKVRELYWLNDAYKKYSGGDWQFGLFASEAWVKANPDLAREAGLAHNDLLRYMYANPQVWKSDVVKKAWKIEDPAVLEMLVQRMPRIVANPPYGPAFKSAAINKAQFLADAGIVPKETVDWTKGIILFAEPW